MHILETNRLLLRELTLDDAPFILELVNDPAWLQFIGDRGLGSVEDTRSYIQNAPMAMYAKYGFGSWLVERQEDGASIGLCGLIKRDTLEDVDIGFSFLPQYRSKGYAYKAAAATLDYAKSNVRLKRVVAITTPDNQSSIKLLERLGFKLERIVTLGNNPEELNLFAIDLAYGQPSWSPSS